MVDFVKIDVLKFGTLFYIDNFLVPFGKFRCSNTPLNAWGYEDLGSLYRILDSELRLNLSS